MRDLLQAYTTDDINEAKDIVTQGDFRDINATNEEGLNITQIAALKNDTEFMNFLIQNVKDKIDFNPQNNHPTPIQAAAMSGDMQMLELLCSESVKYKHDFNPQNNYPTPIQIAVLKDNLELVQFLIENAIEEIDFNMKINGFNILHLACFLKNPEIANTLIQNASHKIDINAETVTGETPLSIAIATKNDEIKNMLTDYSGCDVNCKQTCDITLTELESIQQISERLDPIGDLSELSL